MKVRFHNLLALSICRNSNLNYLISHSARFYSFRSEEDLSAQKCACRDHDAFRSETDVQYLKSSSNSPDHFSIRQSDSLDSGSFELRFHEDFIDFAFDHLQIWSRADFLQKIPFISISSIYFTRESSA